VCCYSPIPTGGFRLAFLAAEREGARERLPDKMAERQR
jgi:hypothetical protein